MRRRWLVTAVGVMALVFVFAGSAMAAWPTKATKVQTSSGVIYMCPYGEPHWILGIPFCW